MRVLKLWLGTCGTLHLLAFAFPAPFDNQMRVLTEVGSMIRAAENAANPQVLQLDATEPARPKIPGRFSAPMKFTTFDTGYNQTGNGFFAQDKDQQAMRVETMRPSVGLGDLLINATDLVVQNKSYVMTGGEHPICRVLPFFGQQRFTDFFSWASNPQLSAYRGQRLVAGRPCTIWALRLKGSHISLCSEGNNPVELNVTLPRNNSGGDVYNFTYHFGTLSTGSHEVPEYLFQKHQICDSVAPACENGRGVAPVPLDAYIFHPGMSHADYNIEDQNVADLPGDALFICTMRLYQEGRLDHNYTLISRYSLEVSPAFGQYAACNGYPNTKPPGPHCFGGDDRLVGREGSFSAGDGEGRCVRENHVGFWYGLPKKGRCPAGEAPGKDAWSSGCTWSLKKRVKTIRQDCLLKDQDYLKYCKADVLEKKGFTRSIKALEAAFASEDPSMGGCADIGGPNTDERLAAVIV